jgi:hypothetical protein
MSTEAFHTFLINLVPFRDKWQQFIVSACKSQFSNKNYRHAHSYLKVHASNKFTDNKNLRFN